MASTPNFDQPLTIVEAVDAVAADHFMLPGIQRSFVWKPAQITTLFDSLMRGYPFGSALVWRTRPMDHKQLRFRRLVMDHDGSSIAPAAKPAATSWIHAVLDGQQRLTAFNIGLRGSYATYSDGNRRTWEQLEVRRRLAWQPNVFLGARYTHFDFERQLNNGYFNPKRLDAVEALAQVWGRAGPFYYDVRGTIGREDADPDPAGARRAITPLVGGEA